MYDSAEKLGTWQVGNDKSKGKVLTALLFPTGEGIAMSRQIAIYRCWGNDQDGIEQQFIVVLNFSDYDQDVQVPFPQNGIWTDLLYRADRYQRFYVINGMFTLNIEARQVRIFYK